ncbi:hypothetical protein BHM03_00003106 [Ensete ventricosum]|uniref:Uncharacterized protein n=1 Tax=Ensete ventricosum TaxID=4639 RepID=A0A427B431_ENSVE|nr:hypothetical protein B296_00009822 [Ensete ventricosum]RZR77898.1 hypothetical protein BHM03_00003106 [Ensete ventricosum]
MASASTSVWGERHEAQITSLDGNGSRLSHERALPRTPNPVALVSRAVSASAVGEDEKRESTAGNEVGKAAMSKRDCSGPSLPSLHRNNLQGRDRSAQWVVET